MQTGEDEEAFLLRRTAEERGRVAQTSCMVRSVHEELVESYEERLAEMAATTAEFDELVERIGR